MIIPWLRPYKSVQFFDVFPFRGVEPKDWWYENVLFTLEKGYQTSIEYELTIWGDKELTGDQIIDIGKKSLKAGTLVFP